MRNAEDVKAGVQMAKEKFGEINVLVNCAGVGSAIKTLDRKGVAHPLDIFQQVIDVSVYIFINKYSTAL